MVVLLFAAGSWNHLQERVNVAVTGAMSEGTRRNLRTQWRRYGEFCHDYKLPKSLPVSVEVLCGYIVYLAQRFRSPGSIANYVYGLKLLHVIREVAVEQFGQVKVKWVMRGVARCMRHRKHQAYPMTPELLLKISKYVDWQSEKDIVFWALSLVAFFLMLRKSNLVPDSTKKVDKTKQLVRGDVTCENYGLSVMCKWSKTNQEGDRAFEAPLVPLEGSVLCPVEAFRNMCRRISASEQDLAFVFHKKGKLVPFTYGMWHRKLRACLELVGEEPLRYSSHSFRRGGATFAFKAQVPGEVIQLMGDWRSQCYREYLHVPLQTRIRAAEAVMYEVRQGLHT